MANDIGRERSVEEVPAVWRGRAPEPLTSEHVRQIAENLIGFFGVLREWSTSQTEIGLPKRPDQRPSDTKGVA